MLMGCELVVARNILYRISTLVTTSARTIVNLNYFSSMGSFYKKLLIYNDAHFIRV